MKRRSRSRWAHLSFGQKAEDVELLLEQEFLLGYHMGMSRSEVKALPIAFRHWYIRRLQKQLNEQNGKSGGESAEPLTDQQKMAIKSQLTPQLRKFI